jgi:23S rRNA (cytidine1920-2'-O)/16S rRNA (cytidine1409-2'-O)-methyltransferase
VDCLLQSGAARVYAVDPGYGILDARLRVDRRVVACERTNALTFEAPEPADLVTLDIGWTPLRLALPGVKRALKPGGRVIALVKPQYEAEKRLLRRGIVPEDALPAVLDACRNDVRELGWIICGEVQSPILGKGGNTEFLWLLQRRIM